MQEGLCLCGREILVMGVKLIEVEGNGQVKDLICLLHNMPDGTVRALNEDLRIMLRSPEREPSLEQTCAFLRSAQQEVL